MAIQKTTWTSETCSCEIVSRWDDTEPDNNRVIAIDIVKKSCNDHKNLLPNVPVTYSCLLDESRRKNSTFTIALETLPTKLGETYTNEDGSTYVVLKNDIMFSYNFEGVAPNRVLHISFIGGNLTQNEKNNIQNKLNNRFGNGSVVIE